MKARVFFLLAAMGLLAGCAKELQESAIVPEEGVKTVLRVGINPDDSATKTYLGESVAGVRKVYWSDGDKIGVNGVASDALTGVAANTSSVDFSFSGVLTTPYNIIYPSSIYADATHVTLPAVQTYKADGFADGFFPMAGYDAGSVDIQLQHLCAVVKVSVKRATVDADTDNLVAVRFKGRNSEKVSGEFAINYSTPALTPADGTGADLEVKVAKNQETSTSTAVDYFIVVPARTYSNGFDIIVKDANGHIMTKSKTSSTELVAGKLYNMTEFVFSPTATDTGIEIASAEDLIAFATNYNSKVYEALGDDVLVATITADITFDASTSAAFNATGGIGMKNNLFGATEDYYFNGIVNGGNHDIKGLEATVPVFAAIGDGGAVSNLNITNTCSFTFTHPNTAELDAGALVGYNKGIVSNVDVAADVTLESGDISQVTALGGIAGRVTIGTLDNCNYSGNISVPDDFTVDAKKTYIGGLVGSLTNEAGKVQDSDFEGTIDFAGVVASSSTSDPYLRLGGIVGTVNAGTVSGCEAKATNTKGIEMDNGTTYTATIQNHSRKAYHLAQGGIAGYNAGTVSSCTNGASVKNFVLTTGTKGGSASDSNSRYYDVGGIVGLNAAGATVSGCTNNGLFESRSTPRIQKLGGIVGYNLGTVSSSSNSDTGEIVIASATGQSPYSLRVGEVGGAIGNNAGTVTNIQNAGNISLSRTENNASVEMKFGGVIGITTAAIDGGVGKGISNSGNITITYNPATVTTDGLRFGGIVGSARASVQNVSNTGNVTYTLSAANVMSKLYMGGIAGEVRNTANVTVNDCENSGEVYFNVNGKAAAHTGNYIGGIIGLVTGEDIETTVSNCVNNGYVHINCNITTACTDLIAAGIVGKMNESGSISDCENVGGASNAGEVFISFSNAKHTDNYAGGILGKTVNSDLDISGCTNSGYIHGGNGSKQNGFTMFVGGIAAYLDGVSSVDNCENNGRLLNDQFNNTVTKVGSTFEGGIVGFALGTSSDRITISNVTNDVSDGGTITGPRRGYGGGAVGYGEYVDIDNATNTNSYNSGSFYNVGGIAGWLVNGTITGSTMLGTTISSSQMQKGGGIVAVLGDDSTVDDCESHVTSFSHTDTTAGATIVAGAIAGTSVASATIQNCHYPASGTITNSSSDASPSNWAMAICSDSNFTDGGGNVADL